MGDSSNFFYWGRVKLEDEVVDDVRAGLMQPRRSLPYFRDYGAGIPEWENTPINANALVQIRYEAVKFVGLRNRVVSDGNAGPDRRAVTSQSIVEAEASGAGLDVTVPVILLGTLATRSAPAVIQIGGSK